MEREYEVVWHKKLYAQVFAMKASVLGLLLLVRCISAVWPLCNCMFQPKNLSDSLEVNWHKYFHLEVKNRPPPFFFFLNTIFEGRKKR